MHLFMKFKQKKIRKKKTFVITFFFQILEITEISISKLTFKTGLVISLNKIYLNK